MGLVQGKCPNCGKILEVDSAMDAAICKHCGVPFIVEKSIDMYNNQNEVGELKEVNIPEGTTKIEERAFMECKSLEKVKLPSTLKVIGASAFKDCTSLREINIPKGIETIEENAFYGVRDCKITIPEGVDYIGKEAFRSVKDVMFMDTPKKMDTGAFWDYWAKNGLCPYCGGKVKLIGQKCTLCKRDVKNIIKYMNKF